MNQSDYIVIILKEYSLINIFEWEVFFITRWDKIDR